MPGSNLLKTVRKFIDANTPQISLDQSFVINQSVIDKIIETAKIVSNDRVLEVGPGLGFITNELAKKAKEVIAIEIDERFKPYLNKLPSNVNIIYGNAYKLLNDQEFRNKIMPITKSVSNIPYSQAQNMLHNYASEKWYKGDFIWLAPASLASKINKEAILGAYFKAQVIQMVSKSAFYPEPKTSSAIIRFKRILNLLETGDFEIYFRRWLYEHENFKVKNAIREGIINAAKDLKGAKVTKNQARELIKKLEIPSEELEKLTNNIKPKYYFEVPKKLQSWFKL